jgi:hypothetical protein
MLYGQGGGSERPYSPFSRPEPLLFLPGSGSNFAVRSQTEATEFSF